MPNQSAINVLVEALAAVTEYQNPLQPVYEVLGQQQPLTLQAIRSHSQLLHDHATRAQDQTFSINAVIVSCKRIPPTPLPAVPLGF
jgi:hypothetical protein